MAFCHSVAAARFNNIYTLVTVTILRNQVDFSRGYYDMVMMAAYMLIYTCRTGFDVWHFKGLKAFLDGSW